MKKIEMYTSDTCPNCTKLKEYLNQNNIEYIEYNISKSSEHKRNLIKEGFLSVPVMKIICMSFFQFCICVFCS